MLACAPEGLGVDRYPVMVSPGVIQSFLSQLKHCTMMSSTDSPEKYPGVQ